MLLPTILLLHFVENSPTNKSFEILVTVSLLLSRIRNELCCRGAGPKLSVVAEHKAFLLNIEITG